MEQHPLSLGAVALGGVLLVGCAVSAVSSRAKKANAMSDRQYRTIHQLPSTLPVLGNTLDLKRNLPRFREWLTELCEKYNGDPFVLRLIGQPDMIFVSSPQAIEDVLKNQFDAFPKGEHFNGAVRDLLGHGIFAVDGDKWVHQRKTASRLFTLRALRETMSECIQKHTTTLLHIMGRQPKEDPLDLFQLLNRFTMEAFAEMGFGAQMNCLDGEDEHPFQTAFDGTQRSIFLRLRRPPLLWKLERWLNIGDEAEFKRCIQVIDSTVLNIINDSLQRRHSGTKAASRGKDIVSLFLDTIGTDPTGENSAAIPSEFDPVYLRDIVVNFIIAGRDTTAQALSWFFYLVSQHPEVERKIVEEVRTKLPQLMQDHQPPSMEDVAELVYLNAALHETLRLYPSVPMANKKSLKDTVLSDGTFVREGAVVFMSFYSIGRLKHVWGEDAVEFKPERWIDAETGNFTAKPASKFVAFNAGPRMCLGKNLALLEMKVVAATVLSKFHLTVTEPEKVTYARSLTMPMKDGLPVVFSPRQA